MADHCNNSIFLIRIDFLKTSEFSSSLHIKMILMDNNQNLETQVKNVGYGRLLAISEHVPCLKMSGSPDGICSQLDLSFLTAC